MAATETPVDPFSDYDNPCQIPFENVQEAALLIQGAVVRSPLQISRQLSQELGMTVYLKKEFLQCTSSFKERGARYTLMKLDDNSKQIGVISASVGNHALGLAYHGSQLGVPVTVVCPVTAPAMKVQKCRDYGAHVVLYGQSFTEARLHALRLAKEQGMVYINGFDHPHVIAGQGTVGLEICQDLEHIDAVLVSVGGGGLISGVSLAIKSLRPEIEVIGVESENGPGFTESTKAGHPVKIDYRFGLTEGAGPVTVGANAFVTARPHVDRMITVSEDYIALAILRMIEVEKSVVEGLGALTLAALLQNKVPHLKGKRVVCIMSGGNIDTSVLCRVLDRGLTVDGRLLKISVRVSIKFGGLGQLVEQLNSLHAKIKDIKQERACVADDAYSDMVLLDLETNSAVHSNEIVTSLKSKYEHVEHI